MFSEIIWQSGGMGAPDYFIGLGGGWEALH